MGEVGHRCGDHCNHLQIAQHILAQVLLRHLPGIHGVDHEIVDPQLLVNAPDHGLLGNGLSLPADKVAIEVHVQIVEGLHVREGDIDEEIVHIEGVLGQLQAAVAKHLGPIGHRVHQDGKSLDIVLHLIPADHLVLGKEQAIDHAASGVLMNLLIDVVGQQHIHRSPLANQAL